MSKRHSTHLLSISKILSIGLTILIAIGFMITELIQFPILQQLVSYVVLIYVLFTLPKLRGTISFITYILIIATIVTLFYQEQALLTVIDGLQTNLIVAAIFIITPLLGIAVKNEKYIEAMPVLLRKFNRNVYVFYIGVFLLIHSLAFVLNIGAVTLVYHLTKASEIKSERIIANVLNRGFATTIFWSPYFSAMALMMKQLHVTWEAIAMTLLGFIFLTIIISFLLELPNMNKERIRLQLIPVRKKNNIEVKNAQKNVLELLGLLILIVFLVLLVERFTSYGMVFSVCLVSLIFPLFWSVIKGRKRQYFSGLLQHIHSLPNVQSEITLFLIAGLFSAVFNESSLSNQLVILLNQYASFSTIFLTIFLSLMIIVPSIMGMHPIILISVLATSINPIEIGITKEYFAVILLINWGLSNVVSPATVISNVLSNEMKESVFDVSTKWNWLFVLIMLFILPLYLYAVAL